MTQEFIFAHEVKTGKPIETSVKKIIQNRVLWEGDSGSGKSHGMTTMIEQTEGLCQRIVIEIEGEYFTLKNNFSFLLVGKSNEKVKADIELNPNDVYVDKLAQKLIKTGVDTIIDLSEFSEIATHVASILLLALMKYAKFMKRPLLIFVDEAHEFAPEKGTGKEESLKAMIRIAKRGRKHGIGLVCGTQAIADFSKNVVRQLRMRFIGNCTFDNDVKAACENLGFSKDRQGELRKLADNHEFFTASEGITIEGKKPTEVLKIKAIANKTKLYDFDFGKTVKIHEKNPQAIKEITSEFADIPQLIDSELSETELLKKEVLDLRCKIRDAVKTPVDPKAIERAHEIGYQKGIQEAKIRFQQLQGFYQKNLEVIRRIGNMTSEVLGTVFTPTPEIKTETGSVVKSVTPKQLPSTGTKIYEDIGLEKKDKLRDGAMKMLGVCAMYSPNSVSKNKMATLSGFTVGGGTFNTYFSELRKFGWISVNGEQITITDEGLKNVSNIEPISTDPEVILSMWKSKFRDGAAKMLETVFRSYPNGVSREELAEKTGFTVGGGTYNTYFSELKRNGLIEVEGNIIKPSKELFPEVFA